MGRLTVVAPLTTIGSGNVDLGLQDWDVCTVGAVKQAVEEACEEEIPYQQQQIWWNGYLLDEDSLSLKQACVGVNKNEIIKEDVTLFLTLKHRDNSCGGNHSTMFHKRSRTVSFDLQKLKSELADITAQSNRKLTNCTMM